MQTKSSQILLQMQTNSHRICMDHALNKRALLVQELHHRHVILSKSCITDMLSCQRAASQTCYLVKEQAPQMFQWLGAQKQKSKRAVKFPRILHKLHMARSACECTPANMRSQPPRARVFPTFVHVPFTSTYGHLVTVTSRQCMHHS